MKKDLLRIKDICTNKSSVEVVKNGYLHIFENEIVGLIGKNHAGKSTLAGAVTGEHPCSSGDIWIQEKKIKIESIQQARKAGIFLIKDETSLISGFTIEDTMKLNYAFANRKVRYPSYVKKYKKTLDFLKVTDDYDTCIQNLNFHKRVLIEIAQALVCNAKILVFDNVFSMLSSTARSEIQKLLQLLTTQGLSFLIIESHAELIDIFLDRLWIMRKGYIVAELRKEEFDRELIMALMEGTTFFPRKRGFRIRNTKADLSKIFEFNDVCTEDNVTKKLTFGAFEGENLGIWNKNRHSGRAVVDILKGEMKLREGNVLIGGIPYNYNFSDCIYKYRLSVVQEEDRIFSNMNLGENISLAALKRNAYFGIIKREGELKYLTQNLCGEYFADGECRLFPEQKIPESILAQKKVALCRAIASGAKIIVYNNPCVKMDVRETEVFCQDILRTQKKKITQIIISSQLEMLYPVCNRILQMDEGKIVKEIKINHW